MLKMQIYFVIISYIIMFYPLISLPFTEFHWTHYKNRVELLKSLTLCF